RRRHTRFSRDWSSDVCSSDLVRVRVRVINLINSCFVLRFYSQEVKAQAHASYSVGVLLSSGTIFFYFPFSYLFSYVFLLISNYRSEERRVGIEYRYWCWPYHI